MIIILIYEKNSSSFLATNEERLIVGDCVEEQLGVNGERTAHRWLLWKNSSSLGNTTDEQRILHEQLSMNSYAAHCHDGKKRLSNDPYSSLASAKEQERKEQIIIYYQREGTGSSAFDSTTEVRLIIYYPYAGLEEQLMEVTKAESLPVFHQEARSQNSFHQRLLSCCPAASLRRA